MLSRRPGLINARKVEETGTGKMKAFNSLVSLLNSGLDLNLDVDASMVHFNPKVGECTLTSKMLGFVQSMSGCFLANYHALGGTKAIATGN